MKIKQIITQTPKQVKVGFLLFLISAALITSSYLIWTKGGKTEEPEPGTVRGTQAETPSDLPNNTPLFEPSTLRSRTESQKRVHLVLETEQSLEQVLSFYQQEMERRGWEGIKTFKPKGGEAWAFTKNDQRLELIVVRNENEEKTLIFLKSNLP